VMPGGPSFLTMRHPPKIVPSAMAARGQARMIGKPIFVVDPRQVGLGRGNSISHVRSRVSSSTIMPIVFCASFPAVPQAIDAGADQFASGGKERVPPCAASIGEKIHDTRIMLSARRGGKPIIGEQEQETAAGRPPAVADDDDFEGPALAMAAPAMAADQRRATNWSAATGSQVMNVPDDRAHQARRRPRKRRFALMSTQALCRWCWATARAEKRTPRRS